MTRLHMNTQRRAILRILLSTDRYLAGPDIAHQLALDPNVVRRALKRFEEHKWVMAWGQSPTRPGVVRRFTINPEARMSIEVVLEGWAFETRPGGST